MMKQLFASAIDAKTIRAFLDKYQFSYETGNASKGRVRFDLDDIDEQEFIDFQKKLDSNQVRYSLQESNLKNYINQIIKEEVRKVRLKESSTEQEIEDLAVDLIDYMGKEVPPLPNPRILRWFQEAGIDDQNLMKQIYQRALQLNAE